MADDDHFLVVCRYVERNPRRAGLVARAEDWRYGSLWRWTPPSESFRSIAPEEFYEEICAGEDAISRWAIAVKGGRWY